MLYSALCTSDSSLDVFDVRFWGAATAAQNATINPGGSVILTEGMLYHLFVS